MKWERFKKMTTITVLFLLVLLTLLLVVRQYGVFTGDTEFTCTDMIQTLAAVGLFLVALIALCYAVKYCLGTKEGTEMTCSDIVQALATVGLVVIALVTVCVAAKQYKDYLAEKRPYVSLMNATAQSNLIMEYPIRYPKPEEKTDEELSKLSKEKKDAYKKLKAHCEENKDLCGRDVLPDKIMEAPQFIRNMVEEIHVTLHFKNTGPLAATGGEIKVKLVPGDKFNLDYTKNPKSTINNETDFKELFEKHEKEKDLSEEQRTTKGIGIKDLDVGAVDMALMPQQKQTYTIMLHRHQQQKERNVMRSDKTETNPLYLLCNVTYNSIKKKAGTKESDKEKTKENGKGNQKEYGILSVYRIRHYAAHTRFYVVDLMKTYLDL